MKQFQREEKYIVVKISDLDNNLESGEHNMFLDLLSRATGEDAKDYVVVSSSMPELYDRVWGEIEVQWLKDSGEYNQAIYKMASIELGYITQKLDSLQKYVDSAYFKKLAPTVQERIQWQVTAMQEYASVLGTRISTDLVQLINPTADFSNQFQRED